MQNNSHSQKTVPAKPIEVGQKPGETQDLIDKISHTGVADSEATAEATGGPGPDATEEDAPTIPLPVVTRNG